MTPERPRGFVGRDSELRLFRSALLADRLPFRVLYVHGPAGCGKTALLHAFEAIARDYAVPVERVEILRDLPLPEGPGAPGGGRRILMQDRGSEDRNGGEWSAAVLGPDTLLVVASRFPPARSWTTDPARAMSFAALELGGVDDEQARELLVGRGARCNYDWQCVGAARGNPLLLVTASACCTSGKGCGLASQNRSSVAVTAGAILQEELGPGHPEAARAVLEVAAVLRTTNQHHLEALVPEGDPYELLSWLSRRSFCRVRPDGVHMMTFARWALLEELRWRDPARLEAIELLARDSALRDLAHGSPSRRLQATADLSWLGGARLDVPLPVRLHAGRELGVRPLSASDRAAVVAMAGHHEGPESAALLEAWVDAAPHCFVVCVGRDGEVAGYLQLLVIDPAAPPAAPGTDDPLLAAALPWLERTLTLRPGERALLLRSWMASSSYQEPSDAVNALALHHLATLLGADDLACTLHVVADPERWLASLRPLGFRAEARLEHSIGGRRFAVLVRDWRAEQPRQLAARIVGEPGSAGVASCILPSPATPRMDRGAFDAAVKGALRGYTSSRELQGSPLLQAPQIVGGDADVSPAERVERLRVALRQAVESLRDHPRSEKLYRALKRTYLTPAPTQAAAADILGLPFSTYRRHLAEGLRAVADLLWTDHGQWARDGEELPDA